MTATPKIHMKSTEDVHILTIEGVNEKHTGEYKCVATNKAGEAEHSAVVTVKGERALCNNLKFATPASKRR